jgi:hypothetical protein
MYGNNVSIPESEPPLYQLQDNGYTVIWAPLLFATVIALSLVGILVPLWEFLFQRVSSEGRGWNPSHGVTLLTCHFSIHLSLSLFKGYTKEECFPSDFSSSDSDYYTIGNMFSRRSRVTIFY